MLAETTRKRHDLYVCYRRKSDTARHGEPRQGTVDKVTRGSKTRFQNKMPLWESPVLQEENPHTGVTYTDQSQKDNLRQNSPFQ